MLLLVVAALLLSIADGRLRKYMSEVCVLTGMPVRSPAEYHVFTTSKRAEGCYIYTGAGGNSPGHMPPSITSRSILLDLLYCREAERQDPRLFGGESKAQISLLPNRI